jgi:glycosyltransferase involved in cell wall biosynthesis
MVISYTILACNEANELSRLLLLLLKHKKTNDEIHVVLDKYNTTQEVHDAIESIHNSIECSNFFVHERKLNKNFAEQKNFAISKCNGDYIFNIDADETISIELLDMIHELLEMNPETDVYYVPRINIVNRLTQEYIAKWNWRINEKGYVNFPDCQMRIHKNNGEIKWINPVHEVLTGYNNASFFPTDEEYCIMHIKDLNRQIIQNNLYDTIK